MKFKKNMSFEDKLNQFLKDSNEKMDQLKTRDSRRTNGMRSRKTGSIDFKPVLSGFFYFVKKNYI